MPDVANVPYLTNMAAKNEDCACVYQSSTHPHTASNIHPITNLTTSNAISQHSKFTVNDNEKVQERGDWERNKFHPDVYER